MIDRAAPFTPQCRACAHRDASDPMVCAAYPEDIPAAILTGTADHSTAYPGDHGIRFEPMLGRAVEVPPGRRHADRWADVVAPTIAKKVKTALAKKRVVLSDIFTGKHPREAAAKALKTFPDVPHIASTFTKAVRTGYGHAKRFEALEIQKMAQAQGVKTRADGDEPDDLEDPNALPLEDWVGAGADAGVVGGMAYSKDVASYLDEFGLDSLGEVYDNLLAKQRTVFEQGLTEGWGVDKLVEELIDKTEAYSDAVVNAIVRTASTDFYGAARLKAGVESGVVKYFVRLEIDDNRTTDMCRLAKGLELGLDHPALDALSGALHWQCRGTLSPRLKGEPNTDEDRVQEVLAMMEPAFKGEAQAP